MFRPLSHYAEVPPSPGEASVDLQDVSPVSSGANDFDKLPDEIVEKILFYVCVDKEKANDLEGIQRFSSLLFTEGRVPLTPDTLAARSVCAKFNRIIGPAPLARAYHNTFDAPCSKDALYPSLNVCVPAKKFLYLCVKNPTMKQQRDFQIKDAGTKDYPFDVEGKQKIQALHAISLSEKHADQVTHIDINTEKRWPWKQSLEPWDLGFLQNFPNLTDLTIGCANIKDLDFLAACQSVNKLNLGGYAGPVEALGQVLSLPTLESLHLVGFKYMKDLGFFKAHQLITSLSLNFSKALQTLEGIQAFPNLQTLSLVCCKNLQDLGALQSCLSLQTLSLHHGPHDLSVLSYLTQLKDVTLQGHEQLASFRQYNQATELESLTLFCCENLSDLGFLQSFPGLKHLSFKGDKLDSVRGVEHCDNLRKLDLTFCRKLDIQGLVALKSCSQLEELVLPEEVHGGNQSIKTQFFSPECSFLCFDNAFTVKKEQIRFLQDRLRELSNETATGSTSLT